MSIDKQDLISILNKTFDSYELNSFKNKGDSVFSESEFSLEDELYFVCFEKGISLSFENSLLKSIHLHFDKKDGYKDYSGWISDYFSDPKISYNDVINLMGEPTKSGGGEKGFMGKIDSPWLRYDHLDYAIHFTFNEDKKNITLVTIMPSDM